jgi:hypothetical protein
MIERIMFLAEQATGFPETNVEREQDALEKLTGDDPESNGVWTDRLAAYDPGEIEAFDVDDEFMAQLGVEYGRS